jgi:hypothetical protein
MTIPLNVKPKFKTAVCAIDGFPREESRGDQLGRLSAPSAAALSTATTLIASVTHNAAGKAFLEPAQAGTL